MDIGYSHALDYLENALDKMVKQAGRNTLMENAQNDKVPVRFARIAEANACDFCKMLASRGFVYISKESAGEFNEWHGHCNCQVVPAFGVTLDRSNSYLDGRYTRGGRFYTQEQVSVRGNKVDMIRTRDDEVNRIIEKNRKRFESGEITKEQFDEIVNNAKVAQETYDPDKLYEEYKSWGESFEPVSGRKYHKKVHTPNTAKQAAMEALAEEYEIVLAEAKSTQELNNVWVRVCTSTNREELTIAQYDSLRLAYRESKWAAFKQDNNI